jgi:hypothetical protein
VLQKIVKARGSTSECLSPSESINPEQHCLNDPAEGRKTAIPCYWHADFGQRHSPALAVQTIESIRVIGVFKACDAVKEALKDRIH